MLDYGILGLIFLIFVLGVSIGSFLNVVILRTLSGESIVMPPSKCPKCQHKLYWWHNIPLLSFLILRGKCAFCGEKISWQYPIVELLTGIMFVLTFLKYGVSIDTILIWIVGSLFIVMATTDWREKVIFDMHAYIIIFLGLLYATFLTSVTIYDASNALTGTLEIDSKFLMSTHLLNALLGILAGVFIVEIPARLVQLFLGTRLFGEGDSYITAALGTIFGWKIVCIIFVAAVILQVIATIPFFIKKEFEQKKWRLLSLFLGFILYACAFSAMQATNLIDNSVLYIVLSAILAFLGVWTCIEIIRDLKDPIGKTLLPFGPALILVGFVFLLA